MNNYWNNLSNRYKYKLAVVIPAYKKIFFKETLQSIANQTCTKFTLYIGDDASPEDLYGVIKEYENKIEIVYKRFDNNLGGTDLVAHWNRCIDLAESEEWVWLFSDDDIMQPNCVETFYTNINENANANLLHFNIDIIDQFGKTIKECNIFPKHLPVTEFFSKRINFKINSSIVEYIFRKSIYYEEGGFQNYELAWCSDDATWIKFGKHGGILTITESKIKWRYSGSNISSNTSNKKIILKKLNSNVEYIKWAKKYFEDNNLADKTTQFGKLKWSISIIVITSSFSFIEKHALILEAIKKLEYSNTRLLASLYLFYWEIKGYLIRNQIAIDR